EVQRRRQSKPANAEVRSHHALPANGFEQAENVLALAEAIKKDGHGADIESVSAQPDQVRVDARKLVEQHPHPLRFGRNFQPEQFLHCQAVAKVVGQWTEIVDPVSQGNDLLVELGFAGLLNAGMQITNIRHDANNGLAVDFKDHTQDAVSGRVLRTHV